MELNHITADTRACLAHFFEQIEGMESSIQFMVVGCSTSRVQGKSIGSHSKQEIGNVIVSEILRILKEKNIELGIQCCEHLNRCIVLERSFAQKQGYPIVQARPVLNAGGAAATTAFELFQDRVVVEHVQADAAIDIGQTGIGMHVTSVQIPIHFDDLKIGQARIFALTSRPKLIGGARAQY